MTISEAKFLFDTELINALQNLIKNAKHRLLLVSPFIDLDHRIQNALLEKISKHDFKLLVLFGKNESNIYKSIKKDSLDFLKQFPNIEIRYNERLHAKFYQNDFDYIMTSLNLYDYSLANNIEAGILVHYASKSILGKAIDSSDAILSKVRETVTQDVLGAEKKEADPIEEFKKIFEHSELKFKSEPIIIDESGIKGFMGGQKLNGRNIIVDKLIVKEKEIKIQLSETVTISLAKTLSASQLSKVLGVSSNDITDMMQKAGLINGDKITTNGHSKGIILKNYMGKDYIAYPENLAELNKFKK